MREIKLDGYIDQESFWGDEITPQALTDALYGTEEKPANVEDVRIVLNSYGGSCNAATQMYDILRSYPGRVDVVISGTAASAATVFVQAAHSLKMTPGSLFMIHDPLTVTYGNVQDHKDTIDLLKTVKESIINMYETRCKLPRDKIASLMSSTKWMDANEAKELGFIDDIEQGETDVLNTVNEDRGAAEKRVQAWLDRHRPMVKAQAPVRDVTPVEPEPVPEEPITNQTRVADLEKRLNACRYHF